jgi:hypothetical protein
MFRDPEQIRRQLQEIIEKFRQKGATTPEKAMTIQELGLPPRFEQAMHRRLGQSGIFIELNSKYYLNEDRLKQIQDQRAKMRQRNQGSSASSRQHPPSWLRYTGILLMLPIGIILALALFYFFTFYGGYFPGEILVILLIVMVGVFVARVLYWRTRRKYWRERWIPNGPLDSI